MLESEGPRPAGPSQGVSHVSTGLLALAVSCFVMSVVIAVCGGPDPSVRIPAIINDDELPEGIVPEHANEFAFEGGPTGTAEDPGENINQGNLANNDIPTDAKPSPLFGAGVFTQRMLRFEEFGPVPLGDPASVVAGDPFPAPANAESFPGEQALEDFLGQYISVSEALPSPFPIEEANCVDLNPWQLVIETFLGRGLDDPPAEGRP